MSRLSFLLVRNTSYKFIYDRFKPPKPTNDLTHRQKSVISAISGALGALASNAFECAAVRKIADVGREAKFQRPDVYRNARAGLSVNVARAFVLNGAIIWPYDIMKEKMWISFGETCVNVPVAVFCASAAGTLCTFALDNIKTRMQAAHADKSLNRLNYTDPFDAVMKSLRHEGLFTHLAGIYPMFLKMFIYSISVL